MSQPNGGREKTPENKNKMKNKKEKLKWNDPKLFIPPPQEVVKIREMLKQVEF